MMFILHTKIILFLNGKNYKIYGIGTIGSRYFQLCFYSLLKTYRITACFIIDHFLPCINLFKYFLLVGQRNMLFLVFYQKNFILNLWILFFVGARWRFQASTQELKSDKTFERLLSFPFIYILSYVIYFKNQTQ